MKIILSLLVAEAVDASQPRILLSQFYFYFSQANQLLACILPQHRKGALSWETVFSGSALAAGAEAGCCLGLSGAPGPWEKLVP